MLALYHGVPESLAICAWNWCMKNVNCAVIILIEPLMETYLYSHLFGKDWLIFMESFSFSLSLFFFSFLLQKSEPWNKFLWLLHLSVSIKVWFAFNASLAFCLLLMDEKHLK